MIRLDGQSQRGLARQRPSPGPAIRSLPFGAEAHKIIPILSAEGLRRFPSRGAAGESGSGQAEAESAGSLRLPTSW